MHTSLCSVDAIRAEYLGLLKKCLTRTLFPESQIPASRVPLLRHNPLGKALRALSRPLLHPIGLQLSGAYQQETRAHGLDWPVEAETMIGTVRLDHLHTCVVSVLEERISGDFVEAGVWRGGACILMRAILKVYGENCRRVWAADSFEGLPKPDGRHRQDDGDRHWTYSDVLAVSLEDVQAAFARYGLLDDQVVFLKGWFKDTLPTAPIGAIAILRLDGDMYGSTMDALDALYPKVSPGGYVVVDDYHSVAACRQAVQDYRSRYGIVHPIQQIDGSGTFWRIQ